MGWFTRPQKPSSADAALEVMDEVIDRAAAKWLYFCEKLPFKDDVPLVGRITAFLVPFEQGVRENLPALRNAPDGIILLFVAKGIEKSQTHSRKEIEEALGIPLPE